MDTKEAGRKGAIITNAKLTREVRSAAAKKGWSKLKDIPGYEGLYAINRNGEVWSHSKALGHHVGKFLKLNLNSNGYPIAILQKNGKRATIKVHQLVAKTFIANINNFPQINHKNGIKIDNRVANLEWCTQAHNMKHAHKTGLIKNRKGIKYKTKNESNPKKVTR